MSEEQTTDQPVEQTTEQPVEEVKAEVKSYVGEDGSLNREAFGELGEHTMFDKINNVEDLAKAYMNIEALKGKKINELLDSEDPEIQSALLKKRGIPEDESGYNFEYEVPEGMPIDEDRINQFKTLSKELGLSKEQAEKIVSWNIAGSTESFNGMIQEQQAKLESAEKELKGEWKNSYENNVQKVANTLDYLGLGEFKTDPAYGSNPAFIKSIYDKIIPLIENDKIIEAKQSQTIATSKERMDSIRTEMFTLREQGKSNDPRYAQLMREMHELTSKIT